MTKKEAKEIMCKVTFYWELGEQTLTQNQINEAIDLAIKALDQQPCEDAISRADVKKYLSAPDANGDRVIYESDLDLLSPVTPQPRWIPCTERLPEDGRPVLIYAWNVHHVVARYDSFRTENGYKKCWVTADAWNGNTEIKHDVIAWMPLPEPYKKEAEA